MGMMDAVVGAASSLEKYPAFSILIYVVKKTVSNLINLKSD
jgi:hypothetical protein